jgi:hypothetical protein
LKYKTKSFKIGKKIDEKRAITPRWVIKYTVNLNVHLGVVALFSSN